MSQHPPKNRRIGFVARILCLLRGHEWWIDIDPLRPEDVRCCARCRTEQAL